jgi:hypothetical protein
MPNDRIDLPVLARAARLRADSADAAERTIEVIWTTGATVRRRRFFDDDIDEELMLGPHAVRLDRLNGGAPFLNSHDARRLDAILGVVVENSARVGGGEGTALIRLSDRPAVEPIWRDIQAGIIRNVSVGYCVHRFEIEKRDGAPELWRAVDWEPLEISAVAIGADPGARVRADDGAEARKQVTAATPNSTADVNTFAGRLEVVEEPRLIPEAGEDPWFLAADPARIDTIEYAYLEGQQGVYTETRMGFEVDGIEIKARHDFASKAIDWRGLYRNAGAAPA